MSKEELIAEIKAWHNFYPKDVFEWDNKEKLKFNRGIFNQFIYEIVENTRNKIIEIVKQKEGI